MDLEQLIQQWQAEGKTPQEIEALKEQHLAQQSETVEETPQEEPQWQSGEIALDEVVLTPNNEQEEEEAEEQSNVINRPDVVEEEEEDANLEAKGEQIEDQMEAEDETLELGLNQYVPEPNPVAQAREERAKEIMGEEAIDTARADTVNRILVEDASYLTESDKREAEMLAQTMDKQGKSVDEITTALERFVERKGKANTSLSEENEEALSQGIQQMVEDGEDEATISDWARDFRIQNGSVDFYDEAEDEKEDAFRSKVVGVAQQMLDEGYDAEDIQSYIQEQEDDWRKTHEENYITTARGRETVAQATMISPEWDKDKGSILHQWKRAYVKTAERPAYEAWKEAGKPEDIDQYAETLGYAMTPQEVFEAERKAAVIPDWARGNTFMEGIHFTVANQFPQALKGIQLAGQGAVYQKNKQEHQNLINYMKQGIEALGPDATPEQIQAVVDRPVVVGGTMSPRTGTRIGGKTMSITDALDYYKKAEMEYPARILNKISQIKELQEEAQVYENPVFLDENGITFEDLKGSVGRQVPQLAMSAFTFGVGAFGQEYGSAYVDNLFAIAEKKYGTKEPSEEQLLELIANGEDEAGVAVGTGFVSGSLEFVGARHIVGKMLPNKAVRNLLRGEFKNILKAGKKIGRNSLSGALTEALTEGSQGIAQDVGRGIATGEQIELDPMKTAEEALQGGVIGGLLPGLGGSVRVIGEGYRIVSRNDGSQMVLDGAKVQSITPQNIQDELSELDANINETKSALQSAQERNDAETSTLLKEELERQEDIKRRKEQENFQVINNMTDGELRAVEDRRKEIKFHEDALSRSTNPKEQDILRERVSALNLKMQSDYDIVKNFPIYVKEGSQITAELDRKNQELNRKIRNNQRSSQVADLKTEIESLNNQIKNTELDEDQKSILKQKRASKIEKLNQQVGKDQDDILKYKSEIAANEQQIEDVWNNLQSQRPSYTELEKAKIVGKGSNVSNSDIDAITEQREAVDTDGSASAINKLRESIRDAYKQKKDLAKDVAFVRKSRGKKTGAPSNPLVEGTRYQQDVLQENIGNEMVLVDEIYQKRRLTDDEKIAFRKKVSEDIDVLDSQADQLWTAYTNDIKEAVEAREGNPMKKKDFNALTDAYQEQRKAIYQIAAQLRGMVRDGVVYEKVPMTRGEQLAAIETLATLDAQIKKDNKELQRLLAERQLGETYIPKGWDVPTMEKKLEDARQTLGTAVGTLQLVETIDQKKGVSQFPMRPIQYGQNRLANIRNATKDAITGIDSKTAQILSDKLLDQHAGEKVEFTNKEKKLIADRNMKVEMSDLGVPVVKMDPKKEFDVAIQTIEGRPMNWTQPDATRGAMALTGYEAQGIKTGVAASMQESDIVNELIPEGFENKDTRDVYDMYNTAANTLKAVSRSIAAHTKGKGSSIRITPQHRDLSRAKTALAGGIIRIGNDINAARDQLMEIEARSLEGLSDQTQFQMAERRADLENEITALENEYAPALKDAMKIVQNLKDTFGDNINTIRKVRNTVSATNTIQDAADRQIEANNRIIKALQEAKQRDAAKIAEIVGAGSTLPADLDYNTRIKELQRKNQRISEDANNLIADEAATEQEAAELGADDRTFNHNERVLKEKLGESYAFKGEQAYVEKAAAKYSDKSLWKLMMNDIGAYKKVKNVDNKFLENNDPAFERLTNATNTFRQKLDKYALPSDDIYKTLAFLQNKADSKSPTQLPDSFFGLDPEVEAILSSPEVIRDLGKTAATIENAKGYLAMKTSGYASYLAGEHTEGMIGDGKESITSKADYYAAAYQGLSQALNQFEGTDSKALLKSIRNAVRPLLRETDAKNAKVQLSDYSARINSQINRASDVFMKYAGRLPSNDELATMINHRLPANRQGEILAHDRDHIFTVRGGKVVQTKKAGGFSLYPGQEFGKKQYLREYVENFNEETGETDIVQRQGRVSREIPKEFQQRDGSLDIVKLVAAKAMEVPSYKWSEPVSPDLIGEISNRVENSKGFGGETAIFETADGELIDKYSVDNAKDAVGNTAFGSLLDNANSKDALSVAFFGNEADVLTDEIAALMKNLPEVKDGTAAQIVNEARAATGQGFVADKKVDEELKRINKEFDRQVDDIVGKWLNEIGISDTQGMKSFIRTLQKSLIGREQVRRIVPGPKGDLVKEFTVINPSQSLDIAFLVSNPKYANADLEQIATEEVLVKLPERKLKVAELEEAGIKVKQDPQQKDRLWNLAPGDIGILTGDNVLRPFKVKRKTIKDKPRGAFTKLKNILASELQMRAIAQDKVRPQDVEWSAIQNIAPGSTQPYFDWFNGGWVGKDNPKFLQAAPANKQARALDVVVQLNKVFPGVRTFVSKAKMQEALIEGGYSDVNIDNIRGMYADGAVLINPDGLNAETPIHEFGHIWSQATKQERPELYNKGIELLKGSDVYQEIDALRSNPESVYYGMNNADFHEEVMATAIGRAGAINFETQAQQKGWQQFLQDMYNYIAEKLGVSLDTMTLEDFLDQANAEILTGEKVQNDVNKVGTLVGKADKAALIDEAAKRFEFMEFRQPSTVDIDGADGAVATTKPSGFNFLEKMDSASKNALKDAQQKKELFKNIYDNLNLKGTIVGPDGKVYKKRDISRAAKDILEQTAKDPRLTNDQLTLQDVKDLNEQIEREIRDGIQPTELSRSEITQEGYSIIQGLEDPGMVDLKGRNLSKNAVDQIVRNRRNGVVMGAIKQNIENFGLAGAMGNILSPASNDDFYGLVNRLLPKQGGAYRNKVRKLINDRLLDPLKQANYDIAQNTIKVRLDFLDAKKKVFGSKRAAQKVLRGRANVDGVNLTIDNDIPLSNSQAIMIYNYLKDPRLHEKLRKGGVSQKDMRAIVNYIHAEGNEKLRDFADAYANNFKEHETTINNKLIEHGIKPLGAATAELQLTEEQAEIFESIYKGRKIPSRIEYTPFVATGLDKDSEADFGVIDNNNANKAYSVMAGNLRERQAISEFYIGPNNLDSILDKYSDGVMRTVGMLDFAKNASAFFDTQNLRAAKAKLGGVWDSALRDSLRRIITGKSRSASETNSLQQSIDRFLNRAIAGVMFLNTKSALLQLVSVPNFMVSDPIGYMNNLPGTKGWKQAFKMIKDSGFFQLRGSHHTDVLLDELYNNSQGKGFGKAYDRFLNKVGYAPTRFADKFAIAFGGAPYLASRIDAIQKESPNMPIEMVYDQAMKDFQDIANQSQQSTQQDRLGMSQTTRLGGKVLSFTNAPQQFNRIIAQSIREMQAGNNFKGNMAKALYFVITQYGLFQALQMALPNAFDDTEEDEETRELYFRNLLMNIAKSAGLQSAFAITLADAAQSIYEADQELADKGVNDFTRKLMIKGKFLDKVANISPGLGTKVREIDYGFLGKHMYRETAGGFELGEDGMRFAYKLQSLFGIPAAEVVKQIEGYSDFGAEDLSQIESIARGLGWSRYSLGKKLVQTNEQGEPILNKQGKPKGQVRPKLTTTGINTELDKVINAFEVSEQDIKMAELQSNYDNASEEWHRLVNSRKEAYKMYRDLKKKGEPWKEAQQIYKDLEQEAKDANALRRSIKKEMEALLGTPLDKIVEHKDSEEDVLGRAYKDGTIEISPDLKGEERKQVIAHEKEHAKQMKDGDLTYTKDSLTWKGKKYPRKNGRLLYKGRWIEEGSSNLPWESLADSAAEKKVGGDHLGGKFTDKKGTKKP